MPRMMRRRLHRNSCRQGSGLGSWITSAVVTMIAADLSRPQSKIRHFVAKLLPAPKPPQVIHTDFESIEEVQEKQIEDSNSQR